jgi:hypothetical protein
MSSPRLEAFLARLYTDDALLERFLEDPQAAAAGCGLDAAELADLALIDRPGLVMAARSFAFKRRSRAGPGRERGLRRFLGGPVSL